MLIESSTLGDILIRKRVSDDLVKVISISITCNQSHYHKRRWATNDLWPVSGCERFLYLFMVIIVQIDDVLANTRPDTYIYIQHTHTHTHTHAPLMAALCSNNIPSEIPKIFSFHFIPRNLGQFPMMLEVFNTRIQDICCRLLERVK